MPLGAVVVVVVVLDVVVVVEVLVVVVGLVVVLAGGMVLVAGLVLVVAALPWPRVPGSAGPKVETRGFVVVGVDDTGLTGVPFWADRAPAPSPDCDARTGPLDAGLLGCVSLARSPVSLATRMMPTNRRAAPVTRTMRRSQRSVPSATSAFECRRTVVVRGTWAVACPVGSVWVG